MSSEAITRNDLKNVLDAILPNDATVQLRMVSINFTGSVSSSFLGVVTAPDVDDHTFVCWVGCASDGYVGSPYVQYSNQATTNVWDSVYSGVYAGCSVHAWALYVGTTPINDQGMADYIVEQGTEGIWTYRKWNSGIAECWGRYQYSTTGTTQWGNVYYNNPTASIAFPTSFFIETPVVSALQIANSVQGMVAASSVNETTVSLYNVRGASSGSGTLIFSVHAIGKWK